MRGSTPHFVKRTLSNVTCVFLQCKVTTYCQLSDEGGEGDHKIQRGFRKRFVYETGLGKEG